MEFISKLRATGMPIRDVQHYVALARDGDTTAQERLDLLEEHRERVKAQLAETARCLDLIDEKIEFCRDRRAAS